MSCLFKSLMGFIVVSAITVMAGNSCLMANDDEIPTLPKDELPAKISTTKIPVGFDSLPKAPKDNPTTPEKAALGRRLFFDPILSNDDTVSCASCHQPKHGFAGVETISIGIKGKKGTRNAPTVLNRVYGKHFSWDGRDDSLEQQALGPLTSETELGGDLELVVKKVSNDKSYVEAFQAVFPESKPDEAVSISNITKAIACFERTLTSGNSKVDRFRNEEYDALSKKARQGLWIFESRGGCWKCHNGANLTDEEFHNTGVGFGKENRDTGRMEATKDEKHKFQFKTPTLRDVEFTAPYMHDGSVKTLKEVVEFYNRGGAPDDALLDKKMKPLDLSEEEVEFLVEFLKALSGDAVK